MFTVSIWWIIVGMLNGGLYLKLASISILRDKPEKYSQFMTNEFIIMTMILYSSAGYLGALASLVLYISKIIRGINEQQKG